MNDKTFSFEGFLGFRRSFCGTDGCFWNPCFISEYGHWHFDKFDFKFSEFFNFAVLCSAMAGTK